MDAKPKIFCQVQDYFDIKLTIDLFASRLNAQLPTYVSHKPDPFATYIDAFTLNWSGLICYIFPPFSLIPRVLQKLELEQADAVMVVPYWPTQVWYTKFTHLLQGKPVTVTPHKENLILPNKPRTKHPLYQKLTLIIGYISGRNPSVKDMDLVPQKFF